MRFRLLRSLVFWVGPLLLAFLLWSWRDSLAYRTGGEWLISPGTSFAVGYADGALAVTHFASGSASMGIEEPGWYRIRPGKMSPLELRVPEYSRSTEVIQSSLSGSPAAKPPAVLTILSIPHWTLLLFVFLGWAVLLGWRVRRARKS